MEIEVHNALVDRAKTKNDGIYSYKGYTVVIKNKNFVAYSDRRGNLFRVSGYFGTPIGKIDGYPYPHKIKDALKKLL